MQQPSPIISVSMSEQECSPIKYSISSFTKDFVQRWHQKRYPEDDIHSGKYHDNDDFQIYKSSIEHVFIDMTWNKREIAYLFKYWFGIQNIKSFLVNKKMTYYTWHKNSKLWGKNFCVSSQFSDFSYELENFTVCEVEMLTKLLCTQSTSTDNKTVIETFIKKIHQSRIKFRKIQNNLNFSSIAMKEIISHDNIRHQSFPEEINRAPYDFPIADGKIIRFVQNEDHTWTFKIEERTHNDFFSICSPVKYNKDAGTENPSKSFEAFIDQVMVGNNLHKSELKKMLGRLLLYIPSDRLYVLYGPRSGNGKSTLINIIDKILGWFRTTIPSSFIANKNGKINKNNLKEALIRLKEKRCAVFYEMDDEDRWVVNNVELMTGFNKTEKKVVEDQEEYINKATSVIHTNFLPQIPQNHFNNIEKRVMVIPFNCLFVNEGKIVTYDQYIKISQEDIQNEILDHQKMIEIKKSKSVLNDQNIEILEKEIQDLSENIKTLTEKSKTLTERKDDTISIEEKNVFLRNHWNQGYLFESPEIIPKDNMYASNLDDTYYESALNFMIEGAIDFLNDLSSENHEIPKELSELFNEEYSEEINDEKCLIVFIIEKLSYFPFNNKDPKSIKEGEGWVSNHILFKKYSEFYHQRRGIVYRESPEKFHSQLRTLLRSCDYVGGAELDTFRSKSGWRNLAIYKDKKAEKREIDILVSP